MRNIKTIKSNRKHLTLLVYLFLSLILLIMQENRPLQANLIKKIGIWFFNPIQKVSNSVVQGTNQTYANIVELGTLRNENKKLKNDLKFYKLKENLFNEVNLENNRLRDLLNFKQYHPEYSFITARIIAKDPTNWFECIIINKGSNDGIKNSMIAITPNGVIGKVIDVSNASSRVQLILDKNSSIGAIINRTRSVGILKGFSKKICQLEYISRIEEIKIGDTTLTSGLGGIFPKGLPLGVVTKVEKKNYGLFQNIEIRPFVDFYKVEEVLVIKEVFPEELIISQEQNNND